MLEKSQRAPLKRQVHKNPHKQKGIDASTPLCSERQECISTLVDAIHQTHLIFSVKILHYSQSFMEKALNCVWAGRAQAADRIVM